VIRPGPTCAVTCDELVRLVISELPFHSTIAPCAKPDPFTVKTKPPPPGDTDVGLRDVMIGPLLDPIVKVAGVELREFVCTITLAVPTFAIRLEGTDAASWVGLTKVVDSSWPLNETTELAWKLDPVTVSVKDGPPGVAKFGFRPLITGVCACRAQPNTTCKAAARYS
jgi:hypothetical protein